MEEELQEYILVQELMALVMEVEAPEGTIMYWEELVAPELL